eukprot:gene14809-biopygen5143
MHQAPGLAGAERTAEGGHLAAKNLVPVPVGTPWGSGMAPRRHPREVENFEILVDFGARWIPKRPPSPRQRHGRAGRVAASPGPRHRKFSPSARFRLRMAETNTRVYSGSKANAPGPGAGRCRSDAEGGHLAAKKPVPVPVGTPSGSGMAPRRHPQEVENFEILMDFGAWWIPGPPLPPQRHGRAGRQLPAGPQHPQAPGIANSALARVLGSEWRKRIPAYTAGPRQMHRAPGLAGADRTQKVAIRRPKNLYWCPLALHGGRIWHPGGTPRKSEFSRFWRIFAPGGSPRTPPPRA